MFKTIYNTLSSWWHKHKIKRQRRKLVSAYADVARIKHDLGPGFSPTLYAYDRLLQEELLVITEENGERRIMWAWPEGAEMKALAKTDYDADQLAEVPDDG